MCVVDENGNIEDSTVNDIPGLEIAIKVPGSGGTSFHRIGNTGSNAVKFSTTRSKNKSGWKRGLPSGYSQGDYVENGVEYTCIFH